MIPDLKRRGDGQEQGDHSRRLPDKPSGNPAGRDSQPGPGGRQGLPGGVFFPDAKTVKGPFQQVLDLRVVHMVRQEELDFQIFLFGKLSVQIILQGIDVDVQCWL